MTNGSLSADHAASANGLQIESMSASPAQATSVFFRLATESAIAIAARCLAFK